MKKMILILTVAMGAMFFTGCSQKGSGVELNNNKKTCQVKFKKFLRDDSVCELAEDNNLILVTATGEYSMATQSSFNNSTIAGLQVASELTLKKKDNYFAIAHPSTLSSFQGSLINTPQEYIKKCEINIGNMLTFNQDPCRLHPQNSKPRVVRLAITTYKEQPINVLTFNAKETLTYLKENDLFDPNVSLDPKKHFIQSEVDINGKTTYKIICPVSPRYGCLV